MNKKGHEALKKLVTRLAELIKAFVKITSRQEAFKRLIVNGPVVLLSHDEIVSRSRLFLKCIKLFAPFGF